MSDFIPLYLRYNPEATNKIFELQPYTFEYKDEDGLSCPLNLQSDEVRKQLFYLDDEDGIWNHLDYGFSINRKIVIKDPSLLFGKGEWAVACADSTLGIAFLWSSKTSSRKSIKKIGTFAQNDPGKEFEISESFKNCSIRGEINYSIILYLESPGNPAVGEDLFVNQKGYLLGELDSITVQIDGNGSILPVFYEDVFGGSLWRVNCNWGDPATDDFSNPDFVSITINRKNPSFKYLDKKNECFNPQFANEVMASAITMIIEYLRNDKDGFSSLNNSIYGSISDAVRYFRDKLNWDLSDPITVNKSIRDAFENRK